MLRKRVGPCLFVLLLVAAGSTVAHAAELAPRHGGTPTGQHSPAVEAQIEERMQEAIELLFGSRLPEAARVAQDLAQLAPRDPRVHLLEARILRESFPDQSTSEANRQAEAAPIHAELEIAIHLADSLIEVDEANVGAHVYRGWACLFRAQMHSLCNEYWQAGRTAKSGKNTLDRALQLDPENADAKGILGTYLYFADVLPRVVKILRTIVRVPGGDRERGIALLRESAAGGGYNRLDARALIGVIQFAFEGDYDAGATAFESLLVDYPESPRFMEPLAAMDLVRPRPGMIERVSAVAEKHATSPADWYRELSLRLTFYQALSEAMQGRADEARSRLRAIAAARPTKPDWFPGDVLLCLTEMDLLAGDRQRAAALYSSVAAQPRLEERLRFVRQPDAAATPDEAQVYRSAQDAARALYAGDLDGAHRQLASLGTADDPAVHYYRGELSRLEGDYAHAAQDYERVTERSWPQRWRLYKVLAYSRLAEIRAAQGDPRDAASTLDRALVYDEDRDLLRHLIRARRRHFELAAESGSGRASPPAGASTTTTDGDSR